MKKFGERLLYIGDNIIGPFKVVGAYWYILLWWIIIFVTLFGPIIDALIQNTNKYLYFINSGTLYYSVITLLFSFVITNLVDMLFGHVYNKEKEIPFLHYHVVTISLSVLLILILITFYIVFRKNDLLQIILSVFGYIFSFYLYCVSYMDKVKDDLEKYSISSYDKQKKKNSAKIQKKSTKKASDGLSL